MAASRNFQEAIADEAGRQLQVAQAVRRQRSMVEAAKYGTQGTRSADNASGSNPFADALAKGAGELTRYGIGELLKDRSGGILDSLSRQAATAPAFNPAGSSYVLPSWSFSSPSGGGALSEAARQAVAKPPVFSAGG